MKDFSELLGQRVGFCGVDNNSFCVITAAGERVAFEVVEDECDGYRSALREVKPIPLNGLVFFGAPIVDLLVEEDPDLDIVGKRLVDDRGHTWLRFGTDNHDDYYPWFTFTYDPPKATDAQSDPGPVKP